MHASISEPIILLNQIVITLPGSESWGPGDASGWYWSDMMFREGNARPAQLPSFRLMCVTSTPAGRDAGSTA